jgi:DNA-binding NarL/FixJ family response regulator
MSPEPFQDPESSRCVLLAHRDHGLTEGMRSLLDTKFETVVMVANETSLIKSSSGMNPSLVVVDLSLADGDALGLIHRWRERFPDTKLIVLGAHDESSVSHSIIEAGADGYVVLREIANDLLLAIDQVNAGLVYEKRVGSAPENGAPEPA